jgi:outer membrane phospholipase A
VVAVSTLTLGRRLCASVLMLVCASFATAARAEWLLASRDTTVAPGKPFVLTLVRDVAGEQAMPRELPAVIETGTRLIRTRLALRGDPKPDALRAEYVLSWPEGVLGSAVLRLDEMSSSRLLLVAEAPADPAGVAPRLVREVLPEAVDEVAAQPAVDKVETRLPALSTYEPMYFLFGANSGASARFQLSFKYRLFDPEGLVGSTFSVLRGLHFGYTQTSLWDLDSSSKPFRDTSYRPALFYSWPLSGWPDSRHQLTLGAGLEHESNGRDSQTSRSINIAFARLGWRRQVGEGDFYVGAEPRLWAYLEKSDNPDIHRYRGYGDLQLRAGHDNGWLLTTTLRRAEGGIGSTQLDFSWPLQQSILADVGAYLHLQYFDGFGETLLDYNQSHEPQLRVGFSIVR